MTTARLATLVVLGLLTSACDRTPAAPPAASSAVASAPAASSVAGSTVDASTCPPTSGLDASRLEKVRAAARELRPGATRAQVVAALGLDLGCFPAAGQGGDKQYLVAYRIAPKSSLGLTWERRDGGEVLIAAQVVDDR